ncbi:MAG: acyloxyacyl hydrolase [Phycisphaeraceae bacterium]|nr:acyloxyacyl hydrolase [Phycisphaeraceae bacterium]
MHTTRRLSPIVAALCLAPAAAAQVASAPTAEPVFEAPEFDPSAAYAAEARDQALREDSKAHDAPRPGFGRTGWQAVTISAGLASDFSIDNQATLSAGWSVFFADEAEFGAALAGWYFWNWGDTGGLNPNFFFRWHFCHDKEFTWSLYGELGIGLLFTFDDYPPDGTSVNISPRMGGGFTRQLNDDGLRLQLGVYWQHFSNGRFEGDDNNPSSNTVMIFGGVMIPF